MAEISYPFAEDNPTTGASKAVSETQWQNMAHMWEGDRVDFQLGPQSYSAASLPFAPSVINVTSVRVGPGRAWVGGFYYELTANFTVPIDANSSNTGRKDLVVIRVDMAVPSANIAVRKGVNAASPVVPQPVRQIGGVWELPLYEVNVPANGGTISMASRAPYNMPPPVSYPWNAEPSTEVTPMGTFSYDLDSDGLNQQVERFMGRHGSISTRTLDECHSYTPSIYNDSNVPNSSLTRKGQWRWVAPNTVSFRCSVYNPIGNMTVDAGLAYGLSLPVPATKEFRQIFSGVLHNPAGSFGYPTFAQITGYTAGSSTSQYMHLYIPSLTKPSSGLDSLTVFPSKSTIHFSGTYEANVFDNWGVVNGA